MSNLSNVDTKKLTTVALLTATEIILSRFLSIATPIVKIGFGFVPLAMVAMLYGPLWAGFAGAMADFLGAVIFPIGAYFPGFTATAFLKGVCYGVFLHRKEITWKHLIVAVSIVCLVFNLGLNTLWVKIITGKGYIALVIPRILQNLVMIPLQVFALRFVSNLMKKYAVI